MCKVETTKEQLFKLCEEKGYCKLTEDIYSECANFLFYTSWFEELLFNNDNRQSPKKLKKICSDLTDANQVYAIELAQFDFYGDYFSRRYLNNDNSVRHAFNQLRIPKKFNEDEVRASLIDYKDNRKRNSCLLWTYLMIAYRFRHNMFHGAKKLINLQGAAHPGAGEKLRANARRHGGAGTRGNGRERQADRICWGFELPRL